MVQKKDTPKPSMCKLKCAFLLLENTDTKAQNCHLTTPDNSC